MFTSFRICVLSSFVFCLLSVSSAFAKTEVGKVPEELGAVDWLRDYKLALDRSASEGKPILILFQEVPGCANCKRYGNGVLSDDLVVEAIEDNFVPLAIFNNKKGADAEVLKQFGEPSWNNPVVRIVDEKSEDIVDRIANFNRPSELVRAMLSTLRRTTGKAPKYLELVLDEMVARERGTKVSTYTTACFWSGEALFGAEPGVVATEAGWQDGKEVVRVTHMDSDAVTHTIDKDAASAGYTRVENGSFRLDREPKYYLLKSKYNKLKMSELQASTVNAALGKRKNPEAFLSPRQLAKLGA